MIRHDITAALFAPVEMLVTENADGAEVIDENKPLLDAAQALDTKLADLVAQDAGE